MKTTLKYHNKAFTLVEIAMTCLIAGFVIYLLSSSLTVTTKNAKTQRTDYDTEYNKFTGVMGSVDNTSAFPADVNPNAAVKKSCKEILDAGSSTGSGEYTIDPDGSGTAAGSFKVFCDMDTSHGGGGWTLVVAQYESSPVTNWNLGINEATFTPPTASQLDNGGGTGFALKTEQLPTGTTQTAFGKGSDATFVGYSNFVYNTGNIAATTVMNLKDSQNYQIHRNTGIYFDQHDPETITQYSSSGYNNTLTFDKIGATNRDFSFSPTASNSIEKGFGMKGGVVWNTAEAFAWTVWVR